MLNFGRYRSLIAATGMTLAGITGAAAEKPRVPSAQISTTAGDIHASPEVCSTMDNATFALTSAIKNAEPNKGPAPPLLWFQGVANAQILIPTKRVVLEENPTLRQKRDELDRQRDFASEHNAPIKTQSALTKQSLDMHTAIEAAIKRACPKEWAQYEELPARGVEIARQLRRDKGFE